MKSIQLRAVSSAVLTVENRIHDAILTAIDNGVIQRVEMIVKSSTGLTGHGTNSEDHNPDRRDFIGNIRNSPLMSASSWLDLDSELNRSDETHNNEVFRGRQLPGVKT